MPRLRFKPRPYLVEEGHSDRVLLSKFLVLVKAKNAASTFKEYGRILGLFMEFLEDKGLELRGLKTEDVDRFLSPWEGRPVHRNNAAILHRFLNFLGLVDPRRGLQIDLAPITRNLEKIRRSLISDEDLKNLLGVCSAKGKLLVALLAAVLYETGLRVHEVVQLTWGCVDFGEGILEVPKRKSQRQHSVPFGLYTQTYLRLLEPSGHNPEEPLFPSASFHTLGDPLTTQGVRHLVLTYGTAAGWRREQCHPHAFRHSFATNLIRLGVPLPVVQELMDHSDIQSTMIYVSLAKSDVYDHYRRVMRPDWKPVDPKGPVTPPTCPKCSIVRLPGYTMCPACGYSYAREEEFGEEHDKETQRVVKLLRHPRVLALIKELIAEPEEKEEARG